METWPNATDYKEVLQHPARAFRDAELQRCQAEMTALGVPRAWAGNFACVFRLQNGTRTYAVKLFKSMQKDRAERYRVVSEYLQQRGTLDFLVKFRYDPAGLRINGTWYPVQTMDWITGDTLDRWVGDRARRGDGAALRRMAEHWVRLIEQLRAAHMAHGDLQHGNVMVVGDRPVLVDYDGMCVPALVGRTALEEGLPGYQHPQRAGRRLSLDLDHFSAWVIFLALRAVAADLGLWQRHVEATQNDNLLFTELDLTQPDVSPLWPELLRSPDAEVRQWARRLREALVGPFEHVPRFEMDPYAALRELCRASPPPWEQIHAQAAALHSRGPLPPDLGPTCEQAVRRVAARDRMQHAMDARSAREAAAAYDPELLDDWPASRPLADFGRRAVTLVKRLDELESARDSSANGRHLVNLWDRYAKDLSGVAEADAIGVEVANWKKRIEACDLFKKLLGAPGATEAAIADAWDRLHAIGGHPDAKEDEARAATARRRADIFERLRRSGGGAGAEDDRTFVTAWDETLIGPCHETTALRPRLTGARQRLAAVDAVEKATAQADRGAIAEEAVLKAAEPIPPGYAHPAAPRVAQARVRVDSRERFHVVARNPASEERAIAEAWGRAADAGGHLHAAVRAQRPRAELARQRADLLDQLRSVPPTPNEKNDRQYAQIWNETLLDHCPEAEALRPRLEQVQERLRLLDDVQRLAESAAADPADEAALAAAAALLPPNYPHRFGSRVAQLCERARLRGELDRLLSERPTSDIALAEAWDRAQAVAGLGTPPLTAERCELAVRRRDCLRLLNGIGQHPPADEQDQRWLSLWDESLLAECDDAEGARERHRLAVERAGAWQSLAAALEAQDLPGVAALAGAALLADYPPAVARRGEIEEALRHAAERDRLMLMLRRGDARGLNETDLRFLSEHETLFSSQKDLVRQLLGTWLSREAGLAAAEQTASPGRGQVLVRWIWPQAGRVSYCYVATHPERFLRTPAEAPDDDVSKVLFENFRRAGGHPLTPLTESAGRLYVTVWPALNLGWVEVIGEPLHLGQVVVPAAR